MTAQEESGIPSCLKLPLAHYFLCKIDRFPSFPVKISMEIGPLREKVVWVSLAHTISPTCLVCINYLHDDDISLFVGREYISKSLTSQHFSAMAKREKGIQVIRVDECQKQDRHFCVGAKRNRFAPRRRCWWFSYLKKKTISLVIQTTSKTDDGFDISVIFPTHLVFLKIGAKLLIKNSRTRDKRTTKRPSRTALVCLFGRAF